MLSATRESAVTEKQGGQSISTEAGESPREGKYQVSATSKPLDASCTSTPVAALPTSKAGESFASSGTDGEGNQQPTAYPSLKDQAGTSASETTTGVAGRQGRATQRSASVEVSADESKVGTFASLGTASVQEKIASPRTPIKLATVPDLQARASNLPLLALGQQAAPAMADQANQQTQPSAMLPAPVAQAASQPKAKAGSTLRRGKWTVEEEAYVARVIQDFNSGFLNAPAGTTLRSYLSEKLQCDPMRITKKFTGDSCIGKRVFHPAVRNPSNASAIDKAQAELDALERRWRRRLEMQQRESAKKAAASAAAAAAASSGRSHGFTTHTTLGPCDNDGSFAPAHSVVTQTASWLDRASNILKETGSQTGVALQCSQQKFSLTKEQAEALHSLPKKEIEMQMKEVERLIHEGPIIQQTSAGIPLMLHHSSDLQLQHQLPPVPTTIVASTTVDPTPDGQQTPPEPADKRMRTGAEDAEALVGFLHAVRASAAAGTKSFSN